MIEKRNERGIKGIAFGAAMRFFTVGVVRARKSTGLLASDESNILLHTVITIRTISFTPVQSMPNLALALVLTDHDHKGSRKDTINTRPHNHNKTPDSTMPDDRRGFHRLRTNPRRSYWAPCRYDRVRFSGKRSRSHIGREEMETYLAGFDASTAIAEEAFDVLCSG